MAPSASRPRRRLSPSHRAPRRRRSSPPRSSPAWPAGARIAVDARRGRPPRPEKRSRPPGRRHPAHGPGRDHLPPRHAADGSHRLRRPGRWLRRRLVVALVLPVPVPAAVERDDEAIQYRPGLLGSEEGYDAALPRRRLSRRPPSRPCRRTSSPVAAVSAEAGAGPAHVLPVPPLQRGHEQSPALAFFTAVNIDGGAQPEAARASATGGTSTPASRRRADRRGCCTRATPLDRGHLVRRLDPAWGTTRRRPRPANDDTFHFTNCSPAAQGLQPEQDHVGRAWRTTSSRTPTTRDLKVDVFTGPVSPPTTTRTAASSSRGSSGRSSVWSGRRHAARPPRTC